MSDLTIHHGADFGSLGTLPSLAQSDRETLERLLWMAPDVALSTAAAVIRTHQADAHEIILGKPKDRSDPEFARLARALVYLGLAIAAPGQGKLLPILSKETTERARAYAAHHFSRWNAAGLIDRRGGIEEDGLPDPQLRIVLEALVAGSARRLQRDSSWIRGIVFSEASALYEALGRACRDQFGGSISLDLVNAHLFQISHTSDLIADALRIDEGSKRFDPRRQRELTDRLRRYGWEELVASRGRTLGDIAAEAAAAGLTCRNEFALTPEWASSGASNPTTGQRYFVRPALLPESGALALWAQEERLKPVQRMLAGDQTETGLRLGLASVEILLEYATRTGRTDFLGGQWTRTINRFGGMQIRFGGLEAGRYGITLFPSSRLDEAVGICPIVEVNESE